MSVTFHDQEFGFEQTLDWNPEKDATPAAAAKSAYRAIRKLAKACGYDPDIEVWIKSPEESTANGLVNCWHVCWESGPYDWACGVFVSGPWGHCETYWGFDLTFHED